MVQFHLLTEWFLSHCDGDWEHSYGFSIDTFDNPGFRIRITCRNEDLVEGFNWEKYSIERYQDSDCDVLKLEQDNDFFVIERKDYGVYVFFTIAKSEEAMNALADVLAKS